MSVNPASPKSLPENEPLLTLPEVAERLDIPVTRVNDLIGDGKLVAVNKNGVRHVPAAFFAEKRGKTALNKFVTGVITLLLDGGYNPTEILEFLFAEDDSLRERPVDALQGQQAREVLRRAQAMAI